MSILASGAFLSGLVGSPHCVGMCGPFVAAASASRGGGAAWHAGRLGTYAVLGAVAGGTGASVPGPVWLSSAIAALLTLGFALVLAGIVPAPQVDLPGRGALGALVRRADHPSRLLLGVVSGLMPCGLVWSALALAVAAGGALPGAAVMVAFGAGTVPLLAGAAVGLRRFVLGSVAARRALAALVLAAGWWTVGLRLLLAESAPV